MHCDFLKLFPFVFSPNSFEKSLQSLFLIFILILHFIFLLVRRNGFAESGLSYHKIGQINSSEFSDKFHLNSVAVIYWN